jgi:hypothetical protein
MMTLIGTIISEISGLAYNTSNQLTEMNHKTPGTKSNGIRMVEERHNERVLVMREEKNSLQLPTPTQR